jgi:hypothetical protein
MHFAGLFEQKITKQTKEGIDAAPAPRISVPFVTSWKMDWVDRNQRALSLLRPLLIPRV